MAATASGLSRSARRVVSGMAAPILCLACLFPAHSRAAGPVAGAVVAPQPVEVPKPTGVAYPVFVGVLPNPNDFYGFANGGWDGNWYVGYDRAWIVKLFIPAGPWKKVYAGAKLGRMKHQQTYRKDPATGRMKPILGQKTPFFGEMYMSVNSTPAFRSSGSFFLCSSEDIPLEPDSTMVIDGAGESRWFWTEVPLSAVKFNADNYVCLWSPTESFIGLSSCPILASGYGGNEPDTWLNDMVRGTPPTDLEMTVYECEKCGRRFDRPQVDPDDGGATKKRGASSLQTMLTVFKPAMAMRLIPEYNQKITVAMDGLRESDELGESGVVKVMVSGSEIERVWLEVNRDGRNWKRLGWPEYTPPYAFTLKARDLPSDKFLIRAGVRDVWGNKAYSNYRRLMTVVTPATQAAPPRPQQQGIQPPPEEPLQQPTRILPRPVRTGPYR